MCKKHSKYNIISMHIPIDIQLTVYCKTFIHVLTWAFNILTVYTSDAILHLLSFNNIILIFFKIIIYILMHFYTFSPYSHCYSYAYKLNI